MLLGINGATIMKSDLPTDVAVAAAAGFKALEIWSAKLDRYLALHSLSELRSLFAQHGVVAASINSIEFITFRSEPEYASLRTCCERMCGQAQALGCDRIVVVPSPTPDGGASREAVLAESVRVLRDLAGIAAPYGVQLAFEFLGFRWCSVRTLSSCWEIVQHVDRDNVGLVLDTCHFYAGGSTLRSITAVPPHKLLVFHINDVEDRPKASIEDAHRLLPGEGVIPLGRILSRLNSTGFDGLCSIELFRPQYWERPPAELAGAARAATLRILNPYFKVQ